MTKKTRKRVLWCSVIAGVVLVGGAATAVALNIHNTHEASVQSDGIVWGGIMSFSSDKGYYHCKMESEDGKFYFFDYKTKQNVAVCNRPNCTHIDPNSCDAFFPEVSLVALYNNKLYTAGNAYYNETAVWQMNVDGSAKKKIAIRPTNNISSVAFMNGKTYYPAMEMELKDGQPTKKVKAGIHAFDLKTRKDSIIVPEREGYEASINFFGAEKDKFLYLYSYYKEKPDPNKDYSGMKNFDKSGIVENLYEFDLRAGKEIKQGHYY